MDSCASGLSHAPKLSDNRTSCVSSAYKLTAYHTSCLSPAPKLADKKLLAFEEIER